MNIVIDTNVLIAGLLKDSTVREILMFSKHKLFIPQFAIEEVRKHEKELLKKSGYSRKDFDFMLDYLFENIIIVPKEKIRIEMKRSEEIMGNIDIKDSSFIATALAIKADSIWSFDKDFKKQNKIRIFNILDLR